MAEIKALAARQAHGLLEPFTYDPGPLGAEQVDIAVEYCGICHSDLSMLDNEWGISAYPFVPGHEAIGRVVGLGEVAQQKGLQLGQRVGVGWNSHSCLHCEPCLQGDQQMCTSGQPTIIGRHGAFAEQVRVHWLWAVPIPEGVDPAEAGPLLCGGATVFAPLLDYVQPTDQVGVLGIGGLGHLAVMFLNAWGCDVTAFTSSPAKMAEARSLGATRVASSTDAAELKKLARTFDFLLVTANVSLDWNDIIAMLKPNGKLHIVGAVLEPIPVAVFPLLLSNQSVGASPNGNRAQTDKMLRFAAQHGIKPLTEHFPMSEANAALDHLRAGKAHYRIVLDMNL
ncbi:NAD(P)-dependent alcohol dehydrogenase [Hymenobacter sp. BT188]|uniref:NADPH-dependent aldehyde reductase Ahr n=1 Tax=Hymenobacter sp. BT188 TaxID=2763504 RepID=UPI001650EBE2|nr:NAD(P)-dependent alcohol dehydrogenase [Hymenobacter sp. BT188]MBC6609080.1 NAD(P)-dependent alcohol dehydrogenase [Hymenobacter sp. BT188]